MEKVAEKVSQLVKRNSKEKLAANNDPDSSPHPPFKPIPHIQLQRSSSLPRIEIDRPGTPLSNLTQPNGKPLQFPPSAKLPQNDYSLGQIIPPNAKKLRVRSFLWVKPSSGSLDTSIYYQLFPVLAINIAALSSGLAIGFSSIVLPQLRPGYNETDHLSRTVYQPFLISEEEGSWIAAVFSLGAILGGLVSAYLGKKFGRRVSLLMLAVPDLLGWILVASAQNLWMMLAGRFLAGLAAAGYSPNIQIFVAEITEARHRGWLSGLTMPIMSLGVLLMYTMGSWLPYHYAAAICTVVPCLLCLCLYQYYDSPYWYFSIGKEKSAHMAIERFRGPGSNIVSEIFTIQKHVEDSVDSKEEQSFLSALGTVFTDKKYLKPFVILNFLFFLMVFSGKFTVDFYAVDFFKNTGSHINEYITAVIIAFTHLIGSLIFIPLVKKISRKLLLTVSSLVMGLSLTVMAIWMYYSSVSTDWVPVVCLLVYMLAAPLGLCSLPFIYTAEFFPSEMRSVLAGLTTTITNIMMAIVIKTFTNLESLLGHSGLILLYSGACFGAILLTLSYVPETKDKSLTVINDKFARLRKPERASPWVTPCPSPSVNSVRKFQYKSQMFTQ